MLLSLLWIPCDVMILVVSAGTSLGKSLFFGFSWGRLKPLATSGLCFVFTCKIGIMIMSVYFTGLYNQMSSCSWKCFINTFIIYIILFIQFPRLTFHPWFRQIYQLHVFWQSCHRNSFSAANKQSQVHLMVLSSYVNDGMGFISFSFTASRKDGCISAPLRSTFTASQKTATYGAGVVVQW